MITMHFLLFQNSDDWFAYYVEAEESGSLFLAWSTIHAFWLCWLMMTVFKKEISYAIHLENFLVMAKELWKDAILRNYWLKVPQSTSWSRL